jgi:hypothetical protein
MFLEGYRNFFVLNTLLTPSVAYTLPYATSADLAKTIFATAYVRHF